jgi:hypothetical protein
LRLSLPRGGDGGLPRLQEGQEFGRAAKRDRPVVTDPFDDAAQLELTLGLVHRLPDTHYVGIHAAPVCIRPASGLLGRGMVRGAVRVGLSSGTGGISLGHRVGERGARPAL